MFEFPINKITILFGCWVFSVAPTTRTASACYEARYDRACLLLGWTVEEKGEVERQGAGTGYKLRSRRTHWAEDRKHESISRYSIFRSSGIMVLYVTILIFAFAVEGIVRSHRWQGKGQRGFMWGAVLETGKASGFGLRWCVPTNDNTAVLL